MGCFQIGDEAMAYRIAHVASRTTIAVGAPLPDVGIRAGVAAVGATRVG